MKTQKFIARKRMSLYMPIDTDKKLKKIINDESKLIELSKGDKELEEAIQNYHKKKKKDKISQNQLSLIIIESCINRISI